MTHGPTLGTITRGLAITPGQAPCKVAPSKPGPAVTGAIYTKESRVALPRARLPELSVVEGRFLPLCSGQMPREAAPSCCDSHRPGSSCSRDSPAAASSPRPHGDFLCAPRVLCLHLLCLRGQRSCCIGAHPRALSLPAHLLQRPCPRTESCARSWDQHFDIWIWGG